MIPEKNRPYGVTYFIQLENQITKRMMIEKIQGRFKPKYKPKKKWNYP